MRYDTSNPQALPYYLREEHYELLRDRLGSINTYIGSFTDFLRQRDDNSLDCFVLLDSQDWMTKEQLNELWAEISRVGSKGARVVFRTAGSQSPIETMVDPIIRNSFVYEEARSKDYYAQDRSAVYGGFHLYRLAV
jgi:S-adenosylmethionine-diacylglycerol 3-amino-3-carboxypropyl transferase